MLLANAQREGIYREDVCFNAQQAAEKAIKALLIQHDAGFPYVHDIAALLTVLEQAGQEIPHSIKQAERLTRYPGIASPIRHEKYTEAVRIAGEVVQWVENLLLDRGELRQQ